MLKNYLMHCEYLYKSLWFYTGILFVEIVLKRLDLVTEGLY